jgi:hypothetical protein
MSKNARTPAAERDPLILAGVGAVSAAILMTELALTRIFSVTMYYHLPSSRSDCCSG